ncbi:MAG: ribosome maturation factor RimM [Fimbriimonadaceae bacterium]
MSGRSPRPSHITIGKVVGPHGILGGLKIAPTTSFLQRFEPGRTIYINDEPVTVKRLMAHKSQIRIETKEITDRNQAERLKWALVSVPADETPELEEDEFFSADLIGLKAVDESGNQLGVVDEVFSSPAHDVLKIGSAMVPAVMEFVKEVDLENGVIVITPIPGMFEE